MQLGDEVEAEFWVKVEHHLVQDGHVAPVVEVPQLLQVLVVLDHQCVTVQPAMQHHIVPLVSFFFFYYDYDYCYNYSLE